MIRRHKVALLVWLAAVAIYAVAVAGRTSFGVAGLTAIDRFGITASTLSLFTVVQIGVYALAQIPVGMLLDRFGARVLLSGGALIVAIGQIGMAVTESLGLALAVRVLIGVGDATAFTAVIRLIVSWFPPRRAPLMTQLTGIVGAGGQLISAVPFALILTNMGWNPAFVALAFLGVVVAILGVAIIRDTPRQWKYTNLPDDDAVIARQLSAAVVSRAHAPFRQTLREPAAWLGFWSHWTCNFPNTVFILLWGVPFLQIYDGYSQSQAAAMLVIVSVAVVILGPVIGHLTAKHYLRRVWLVNGIALMMLAAWTTVLLLPAPTPTWITVGFLIVLAMSGVGSSISFDFVRTAVPAERMGIANGLANMGGFIAGLIVAGLIGVLLDWSSAGAPLQPRDFRVAMSVQLIVWLIGMVGIDCARRRTRRRQQESGIVVPPLREVIARYEDRFQERTRRYFAFMQRAGVRGSAHEEQPE
ncbi:MFS transporter [Trueperella sp. LYQ143]|uniref:MFS transporter n=1 Tax=unclassified Trueperella TaxID=2630174 RepID=UPI0039831DBB